MCPAWGIFSLTPATHPLFSSCVNQPQLCSDIYPPHPADSGGPGLETEAISEIVRTQPVTPAAEISTLGSLTHTSGCVSHAWERQSLSPAVAVLSLCTQYPQLSPKSETGF